MSTIAGSLRRASCAAALAAVAAMAGCSGGAADPPAVPSVDLVPVSGADVAALVRDSDADVVVLNVWATWCQPCREEFPDLLELRRRSAPERLDLLLVSGDFEDQRPAVAAFLREHGVDFTTYLKTGKDMDFIDAIDPRWTGALPVTLVYTPDRSDHLLHEGKATLAELQRWVEEAASGRAAAR